MYYIVCSKFNYIVVKILGNFKKNLKEISKILSKL